MAGKAKSTAAPPPEVLTQVPEWASTDRHRPADRPQHPPGAAADPGRGPHHRGAPRRRGQAVPHRPDHPGLHGVPGAKNPEELSGSTLEELTIKKLQAEVELKESQGALHKLKTAIAEGKYLPAEQVSGDLSDFLRRLKQFADRIPARVAGTMSGYLDGAAARAMKKDLQQELDGCSRPLWRRPTSRTVGRTMTRREAPAQGGALRRPPVDGPGPPGTAAQKAAACVGLGRGQPDPARHQRGGGPLRNALTPYLMEIMDAFSDDTTEQIVFVKPTQVGGTSAMENALGSAIDQDPGPAMMVYPSDQLAKRTVESKLEPMFKSCPALAAKYRAHESEDLAQRFDGMTVYLTGANSPADLSSTPIRYLFSGRGGTSTPAPPKRDSDPVSLAVERTKSYRLNRKIFMASTPDPENGADLAGQGGRRGREALFRALPPLRGVHRAEVRPAEMAEQRGRADMIQRARRARYGLPGMRLHPHRPGQARHAAGRAVAVCSAGTARPPAAWPSG